MKINYRNTKEILTLAYLFAKDYIDPKKTDDDLIPIIKPESAGTTGPIPMILNFENSENEINYIIECIQQWKKQGIELKDIAVVYRVNWQGNKIQNKLNSLNIPNTLLADNIKKKAYSPASEKITLLTMHSSKGLEFQNVILIGIDKIKHEHISLEDEARLLYVGMTRAMIRLIITFSEKNVFTQKLQDCCRQLSNCTNAN